MSRTFRESQEARKVPPYSLKPLFCQCPLVVLPPYPWHSVYALHVWLVLSFTLISIHNIKTHSLINQLQASKPFWINWFCPSRVLPYGLLPELENSIHIQILNLCLFKNIVHPIHKLINNWKEYCLCSNVASLWSSPPIDSSFKQEKQSIQKKMLFG